MISSNYNEFKDILGFYYKSFHNYIRKAFLTKEGFHEDYRLVRPERIDDWKTVRRLIERVVDYDTGENYRRLMSTVENISAMCAFIEKIKGKNACDVPRDEYVYEFDYRTFDLY